MNLMIDLPDDQVAALKAKAQAEGITAEQYARIVLEQDLKSVKAKRHISEVIADIIADAPPEEIAKLARDGASEHDHYIYGWPKKEAGA